MVIHTDIKPLIVAGFVLVLINSSDGYPLYQQRKDRDAGSQGRMVLLKKSCMDSHGNTGICMFKWDCISRQGIALSTCADGFLFGACCSLNENLEERWTNSNDEFTTDNEQKEFYTVSLIYNFVLNDTQRKTTSMTSQKEDSFEPKSSKSPEMFNYDPTTSSTDAFTFIRSSISRNATDNNYNKIYGLVNGSHEQNSNNSHFSNSSEKSSVYDTLNIKFERNQTTFQINTDNSSSTSDFKLFTDAEKSENKLENFTVLNIESSYFISTLVNNKQLINYSNEFNELAENFTENLTTTSSTMVSESDTLDNNFFSETTFSSSQFETLADLGDFITENEASRLKSEVITPSVLSFSNLNTEKYNNVRNMSVTTAPTEDNKTSILKQIVPSLWNNGTRVLSPALQYVISQLTSREASFSKPSADPTTQSNLTSIMSNTGKGGNFESLLSNNLSDNLKLSFNIPDLHADEKKNSALDYLNGLEHYQHSGNEQQAHQIPEKSLNSTNSYISDVNTSFHDSHLNNLENVAEVKEKDSGGMNENNELALGLTLNEKIQNSVSESNYNLNSNTQEILKVVCDNESNFSKYCSKHFTSSETDSYGDSDKSIDNNLLGITQAIQNLNFMTDLLDFNTISDETERNENNNKIIPISSQHDKIYVYNQPTASTETYFIPTNGTNDEEVKKKLGMESTFESGEQTNIGTDMNMELEVYDTISNSTSNEEFLFDITTDILTYFIKLGDESSESVQSDFLSTANEQNLSIQYTELTSHSPSHSHIQQTHDSSFQPTLSKILDDSSTNYPVNVTNDNLSLNSSSILSSSSNVSFKNISHSTISDEGSIAYLNNNTTVKNFTHNNNSSTEEYFYETTDINQSKINFSINSTSSSISESPETDKLDFMNITEISFTFLDVSQKENGTLNTTKIETLNIIQNNSDTYIEISSIPYVNNSINTTKNNLLAGTMYNSSNHQTIFEDVNIFNDSDSLHTVFNVTIAETYSSNFASNSTYIHTSTENFKTVITTQPHYTTKKPTKSNSWDYKKDCGVVPMQPTGRIVGGRNSHFGKWPWQALVKEATWLGLFVKNKCGGVLITSKYVLTAAHCQPGFLASLLVVLGTHDLSDLDSNGIPIIRNVRRMVVHRHYNPQTFENDLALLELETELEFMPHIVPICLPHRNEDFTGEMAFVTGWGKLTHGGDVPNILQEVQVPIVDNGECQMMFYQAGHQKVIQNNFVCAGYTNGGQDSCEGDSGGPLMVQRKDNRWVLVGTVSHGIGCADPNLPGVYMRMSSYRPWIDSIVNK